MNLNFDKKKIINFSLIGLVVVILIFLAITVGRIIITPPEEGSETEDFQYFPESDEIESSNRSPNISQRVIRTIGDFINGSNQQNQTDIDDNRLFQISNQAISGFNFLDANRLYFIERNTGHMYINQISLDDRSRLSNTAAPGIYKIWWNTGNDPLLIVERVAERLSTRFFSGVLEEDGDVRKLAFSPIGEVLYNPTQYQNRLFYITDTVSGQYSLLSNSFSFNEPEVLIEEIPVKEFSITPTKAGVFLTTKPSYTADGALFRVTEAGELNKILKGSNGFQAKINQNGDKLIVSQYENQILKTYLYNIESGEKISLTNTYLPDKCTSSQESTLFYCAGSVNPETTTYPNDWYKGLISHNDNIWQIDTETGTETSLTGWTTNNGLDVYQLRLDTTEDFLVFINKKDLSLWSFDLREEF